MIVVVMPGIAAERSHAAGCISRMHGRADTEKRDNHG